MTQKYYDYVYDYGDDIVQDLSKNEWKYKVGLHGEHEKHYTYENSIRSWFADGSPTRRIFVWYKVIYIYILLFAFIYSKLIN